MKKKNPSCNISTKTGGRRRNNSCFLCPRGKEKKEFLFLVPLCQTKCKKKSHLLSTLFCTHPIRQANPEGEKVDGAAELPFSLCHAVLRAQPCTTPDFSWPAGALPLTSGTGCAPVCAPQLCWLQPGTQRRWALAVLCKLGMPGLHRAYTRPKLSDSFGIFPCLPCRLGSQP